MTLLRYFLYSPHCLFLFHPSTDDSSQSFLEKSFPCTLIQPFLLSLGVRSIVARNDHSSGVRPFLAEKLSDFPPVLPSRITRCFLSFINPSYKRKSTSVPPCLSNLPSKFQWSSNRSSSWVHETQTRSREGRRERWIPDLNPIVFHWTLRRPTPSSRPSEQECCP